MSWESCSTHHFMQKNKGFSNIYPLYYANIGVSFTELKIIKTFQWKPLSKKIGKLRSIVDLSIYDRDNFVIDTTDDTCANLASLFLNLNNMELNIVSPTRVAA